jgi:hypothetical protein
MRKTNKDLILLGFFIVADDQLRNEEAVLADDVVIRS